MVSDFTEFSFPQVSDLILLCYICKTFVLYESEKPKTKLHSEEFCFDFTFMDVFP